MTVGRSFNGGTGNAKYHQASFTGIVDLSATEFAQVFSDEAFLNKRFHEGNQNQFVEDPNGTDGIQLGDGDDVTLYENGQDLHGTQTVKGGGGNDYLEG